MKKLLIAGNIIFAAIICFQACNPNHEKEILKNMHCSDYSKESFDGISYATADTMYKLYQQNQYKKIGLVNTSAVDKNEKDSKCIWFSLETLKKFIYKIEDTLGKQNLNPDVEIGVRIYYATYMDSVAMKNGKYQTTKLPSNYQFHHTVFMMPTFTKKTGTQLIHYDFNPATPLGKGGYPLTLDSARKMYGDKGDFWTTPGLILGLTDEIYMQNHGELGPPPPIVQGSDFK